MALLKKVNSNNISNVPVVDENKRLLGLITNSSLVTTMSQQFIDFEEGRSMSGLLAYVQDQQQYIGLLLLSHIQLTLLSVAIAVCIGVPLGIYISERERLLRPVMGFANLAQAIPSLALLGFLVPYMGIGAVTAVAMVVCIHCCQF